MNLGRGFGVPTQLIQLDQILDEMRLHKSDQEIALMQIASNISADAHTRAMQKVHPEMMEYALEAELNYIFGQSGCVPAYNSIVGGGKNGCILHYVENNQPLKDGDLVLIDTAAEYECYCLRHHPYFSCKMVSLALNKKRYIKLF